ncbi:MAG TPA: M14 family zinc carboxypeptidase [Gaiellaceae bacterium]|nr:M14 family zinc carboxypeptidase [Gaiellaceae bacterium]
MARATLTTRRLTRLVLLALVALVATLATTGTAGAAINPLGPPWCGEPMNDAAGNLPDGSSPTHPVGSFPHIPYYAIKCTLDEIQALSNGRMEIETIGESALGRPLYLVTFNVTDTDEQRKAFLNWREIRKDAVDNPARAQEKLAAFGDDVKIPVYIQGAIHGNEYEGVESNFELIYKLATTPYGEDPLVDKVLDNAIVLFNVIQNPDGRIAGTRANGNGFDLNRDFMTQSQSETKASISVMQRYLPPEMLDLHGYVSPMLIEATTLPHNPSIEYDLWLKWNQPRTWENKLDLMAEGNFDSQRPINEWCQDDFPSASCPTAGPDFAEGWDDWGPFYTPMYLQHFGLDSSTTEMCNSTGTICGDGTHQRGRLGSRMQQEIVSWSTLEFAIDNKVEMLHDMLERNVRGKTDAPRPDCCEVTDFIPTANSADKQNWMTDYPKAFVIPLGEGQRSDAEANRLAQFLLDNAIEVHELKQDATLGDQTFQRGSYVVWMTQAFRGFAGTALGIGDDVSSQISQLYAPPASWSHGYLWGADVVTVPDGADFGPLTNRILKPKHLGGGVEPGRASAYALEIDSATAVRVLNGLLDEGVAAQVATTETGGLPAGSVFFGADPATTARLDSAGKGNGLTFRAANGSISGLEPIERKPRIAVLVGSVDQQTWVLRNLGFDANPVSTATINSAADDPLAEYDIVFNTGNWPGATQQTARDRLTAFFARGGGYIGAGSASGTFLQTGGQIAGYAAATRSGAGRSGIVNWINQGGSSSPIVGTYPANDTAIMDPPTWFTSVPGGFAVDGRFPASGILASGFWLTSDAQSASAPNSAVIVHGENIAGTARATLFAMNPLYRADPERMWPAVGAAAYWAQQ